MALSNEELAQRIQSGETALLPQLWAGVERFVKKLAWRYYRRLALNSECSGRATGIEVDDLVQSGFEAVLEAVKLFDPEKSGFLSYLSFHLRNSFADTAGIRTVSGRRDPLRGAVSADAPIGEDGEGCLLDLIPSQDTAIADTESAIDNAALHESLERALDTLRPSESEILRLRYYGGLTMEQTGKAREVTRERVRQIENGALRKLRRWQRQNGLFDAWLAYANPYSGNGLGTFQRTGSSGPERAVLKMEAMEERHKETPRVETVSEAYERREAQAVEAMADPNEAARLIGLMERPEIVEVMTFHYIQGLGLEAIAETTGMDLSQVRTAHSCGIMTAGLLLAYEGKIR